MTGNERIAVLSSFLGIDGDEIEVSSYDEQILECPDGHFLVVDDEEADEKCDEYILDSLWAFNPEFLASYMPKGVDAEIVKIIQEKKCEGANDSFRDLIDDEIGFCEEAKSDDGRGHFLSNYDGKEHKVELDGETYYVYQM